MKSGVKNCDSNENSGPIPSQKAQQRVVCSTLFLNIYSFAPWYDDFLFHRMINLLLLRLNIQMIVSSVEVMDSLILLFYTKVVAMA
jgi:hypothetical protein